MSGLTFTKAVASGNDFILIDNRKGDLEGPALSGIAKKLCRRRFGAGADGLLLLENSEKADIKMRVFNPDGGEAETCGNGLRCAALYVSERDSEKGNIAIETLSGVVTAAIADGKIKIKLADPRDFRLDIDIEFEGESLKVHYVNTGVPHVIHFVSDLENTDVAKLGSFLRHHEEFRPEGTNADFVRITSGRSLVVRTFERGVEAETLACGTGVAASAVLSARLKGIRPPVYVKTRGKEELIVYFDNRDGAFSEVYLEGGARLVYEGRIEDV